MCYMFCFVFKCNMFLHIVYDCCFCGNIVRFDVCMLDLSCVYIYIYVHIYIYIFASISIMIKRYAMH